MWIMVSGPYKAGGADAAQRAENLRALNAAAVTLHRAGHVPVIGVNMALPMIEAAGGGAAAHRDIMMPLSLALVERCDACLRLGGPSQGADDEMERFAANGRPVYRSLGEIPLPS
jgi:ribosomal protein S12 methylthiotransferase accessory factor YcaO